MKFKLTLLISAFLVSLALTSCSSEDSTITPTKPETIESIYEKAIADAVIAEESEISSNLIALTESNPQTKWQDTGINKRVLVVTWTKYDKSYPIGDTIATSWGDTWVVVPSELKEYFAEMSNLQDSSLSFRTKQLLGLPVSTDNKYFAELWVKPQDLFRPAYVSSITETKETINFSVPPDSAYLVWFNSNIIKSYFPAPGKLKYPWTRLGYTYNWGNSSNEKGLSEFVIKKDAKVIVKDLKLTKDYIY